MSRTRKAWCAFGVGLVCLSTLGQREVTAAPPAAAARPTSPEVARRLERLRLQLDGQEPSAVAAALESIGTERFQEAAPVLGDFINRGATPELIAGAVKSAGALKATELLPIVAPLIAHRDKEVRRRVVEALALTGGPDAIAALRRGLRGPDAAVRGAASSALGDLHAVEALPDLFKAFERNVGEAASAIGQVCDAAACRKFADTLGRSPFDLVTSGFDQIFFRPSREVPEEVKIEILQKLAALQTNEVNKYLAELEKRSLDEWSPKLRKALDRAVKQTGGR
jgi:HEAT repeat protein